MGKNMYTSPTIETIEISIERGFLASYPGGDVEPMSNYDNYDAVENY